MCVCVYIYVYIDIYKHMHEHTELFGPRARIVCVSNGPFGAGAAVGAWRISQAVLQGFPNMGGLNNENGVLGPIIL